jgi:hypothetical protein
MTKDPLSVRNNNPGNLRFANQTGAQPGEGGFARFDTPEAGLAAMQRQIELDTQRRGLTLDRFVEKYAPQNENDTSKYLNYVASRTGLSPTESVSPDKIPALMAAMIQLEGGSKASKVYQPLLLSGKQTLERTSMVMQAPPAMNQGPRTTPTGKPTATGARTTSERFPPLSNLRIEDFPMNYQTALALEYLVDTDDDDDPEEKVERLLQEQQAQASRTTAPAGAQTLGKSLGPRSTIRNPFEVLLKMQGQDVNSMEQ